MPAAVSRLAFIDALKAIASQLIVLHHLAFYGPMSDVAQNMAPSLISWLSQDARIAVQVFLVIGGFLAAKGLAPNGKLIAGNFLIVVRNRYLKLAIPYLAALLLSIVCAFIARQWMEHDSIPDAPTAPQFLAHAFLLQNILGFDAISAGVWYIAIDFQLFVLLLGMLWLARRVGAEGNAGHVLGLLLVIALGVASLFYFNRDAAWDDWGLYFFASYALGALAYWASTRRQAADWLGIMAIIVVMALLLDFRSRLAVALAVALMLGIFQKWDFLQARLRVRPLTFLGRISYSVFLLNFPICLVINALFSHFAPDDPMVNAFGVLIAWAASVAAGALFYRAVESRTRQIEKGMMEGGRVIIATLTAFLDLSPTLRLAWRSAPSSGCNQSRAQASSQPAASSAK
jgi:peptidoglycan/LPS O-acetylase OafA/YrhL